MSYRLEYAGHAVRVSDIPVIITCYYSYESQIISQKCRNDEIVILPEI